MKNQDYNYYYTRNGLSENYKELKQNPIKITFFGNITTVQKDGYKKYLAELIDQES